MCVLCSVRMNSLDCAKTHMSGKQMAVALNLTIDME